MCADAFLILSALPSLKAGLAKHGYRLSDIRHVFLSHIHLDQAGAAWALAEAGAQIYVHPFGAPHLIDPSRLMNSAKMNRPGVLFLHI